MELARKAEEIKKTKNQENKKKNKLEKEEDKIETPEIQNKVDNPATKSVQPKIMTFNTEKEVKNVKHEPSKNNTDEGKETIELSSSNSSPQSVSTEVKSKIPEVYNQHSDSTKNKKKESYVSTDTENGCNEVM